MSWNLPRCGSGAAPALLDYVPYSLGGAVTSSYKRMMRRRGLHGLNISRKISGWKSLDASERKMLAIWVIKLQPYYGGVND